MAQAWLLPDVASRPPARGTSAPGTPAPPAHLVPQAGPVLVARLFGELEVTLNGATVPLGSSRRTRSLLAYLLDRGGRPVPRDVLMEVFWPASEPGAARNSLHVALSSVRKALGQAWPGTVLEYRGDVYRLAAGVQLWTDVAAFEAQAAAGAAAHAAGRTDEALEHLAGAQSLYRDELLAGDPYLDWAHRRREELRLLAVTCSERRSQLLLDRGDLEGAVTAGQQALRDEPCHEPAARRLMIGYARLGQPHMALRHYDRIVDVLSRVLGVPPAAETVALADDIRRRLPV